MLLRTLALVLTMSLVQRRDGAHVSAAVDDLVHGGRGSRSAGSEPAPAAPGAEVTPACSLMLRGVAFSGRDGVERPQQLQHTSHCLNFVHLGATEPDEGEVSRLTS